MQIFLNTYNENRDCWENRIIKIGKTWTLVDLKTELEKLTGIPKDEQLISKQDYSIYNAVVLLDNDFSLSKLRIFDGGKIYLEKKFRIH